MAADPVALCPEPAKGFPHLIHILNRILRKGRSVPIEAFDRYLARQAEEPERYNTAFVQALGVQASGVAAPAGHD